MEGEGTTNQDLEDIEILLGEIQTSKIPLSGETNTLNPSPELETVPMEVTETKSSPSSKYTALYNSHQYRKNEGNMVFHGGLTLERSSSDQKFQSNVKLGNANSGYETPAVSVEHDEPNLPDDESLPLAFQGLIFRDGVAMKPVTAASVKNNKTSTNPPNYVNHDLLGFGSIDTSTPPVSTNLTGASFRSPKLESCPPFMSVNGFNEFSGKIDGRGHTLFPRPGDHELKNYKPEYLAGDFAEQWQNYPMYPGDAPTSPAMHAYQFVPNAPVPRSGLGSAYQRRYYLDEQSPVYMSPQQLGQSDMEWQNLEERYCRMNQHHFYTEQLLNQGSTVNQIPTGANNPIMPLAGSTMQSYFEMPISRQIEQGSRNSYWNINGFQRLYNELNPSAMVYGQYPSHGSCREGDCCRLPHDLTLDVLIGAYEDCTVPQVYDKVRRQYLPDNSATMSHGVNSLVSRRSDSMTTNQSPHSFDNNRRAISSGHVRYPLLSSGFLHLEDQICEDSSNISDSRPSKSVHMKYSSVDEIGGRILSIAKDQHGCRFLQKQFTEGTPEDVRRIFDEIIGHIVELMTDRFGNYLIQKLVEVCSEVQQMHIVQVITRKAGELIRISCDTHGTRAVQKVIEKLRTPEQFSLIVSSLKPGIIALIKDVNGNHVAQRCLYYLSPKYKEALFDPVGTHCFELATDQHGCCVLQKCIENSDGDQLQKILSEISSNSLMLSLDQYGNYVVQFILKLKIPWVQAAILAQLEGNYEYLSMQKFASHVVEDCLELDEEYDRVKIIQELMTNPHLLQIMQNQFGNFIIQRALSGCKGTLHDALEETIMPHVPVLRNSPYGRKILPCLSRKYYA